MATLGITLDGQQAGEQFHRQMNQYADRIKGALAGAAKDAADEIETRGAEDIEEAGNFGSRWTEGLHADVTEVSADETDIIVWHEVPYWHVFEYGATIHGRPLLWIPLSFADDAQSVSAKDYPGVLFRVDRLSGGKPLLLSATDKQPKYFGAEEVVEPQKFHLREIAAEVASEIKDFYAERMGSS